MTDAADGFCSCWQCFHETEHCFGGNAICAVSEAVATLCEVLYNVHPLKVSCAYRNRMRQRHFCVKLIDDHHAKLIVGDISTRSCRFIQFQHTFRHFPVPAKEPGPGEHIPLNPLSSAMATIAVRNKIEILGLVRVQITIAKELKKSNVSLAIRLLIAALHFFNPADCCDCSHRYTNDDIV